MCNQLRPALKGKLQAEHVADLVHVGFGDAEFLGNLAGRKAVSNEGNDFPLPFGDGYCGWAHTCETKSISPYGYHLAHLGNYFQAAASCSSC